MTKAHVIRMNDGVMGVFLGDEVDARAQMDSMALEYFTNHHLAYEYGEKSIFAHLGRDSYARYRQHIHWNITEADIYTKNQASEIEYLSWIALLAWHNWSVNGGLTPAQEYPHLKTNWWEGT